MASISELMRLLQFGDSVLPVGSFSFSNGLETAVQQKIVHDTETLREFVTTVTNQAAQSDGIAVIQAHRAAVENDFSRILAADHAVHNRKLNEEMRTMTVRMGRKLAEMLVHVHPHPMIEQWLQAIRDKQAPGTYPVAQALATAALKLSEQDAFAVHQYGVASMILGSALRLMKIHYLDTQSILFQVNSTADDVYRKVADLDLNDMSVFAPQLDILNSIHIKARIRLFMN